MSDPNKLLATDAEYLACLTAKTRTNPADFTAGKEFLEREFSYRAIRMRDKRKLRAQLNVLEPYSDEDLKVERVRRIRMVRESRPRYQIPQREINRKAREEAKRVSGHSPMRAMLLQELQEQDSAFERKHGRFVKPRWAVLEWARSLDWMLEREHAEAAVLVAVFFYDCSATPNPAFPEVLRRIPWGGPDSSTGNEMLRGRWIYLHTQGYPAGLVEIAKLADARMSSGEDAPQRADTTKPVARRRRAKFDKTERKVRLVDLLTANPEITNVAIAAEMGVDPATVGRWPELKTLRAAMVSTREQKRGTAHRDSAALKNVDGIVDKDDDEDEADDESWKPGVRR